MSLPVRRHTLLIVIALCACSAVTGAEESSESLFTAATRAFKLNDFELALQLYTLAAKRGMDDARLNYNLGVTYYKLEQYEKAYQSLQLASRDREFSCLAHINMGLAAARLGEIELAQRQFKLARFYAITDAELELAENMLTDLSAARLRAQRSRLYGAVRSEIGYNDNVILENANYTIDPVGEQDQYLAVAMDTNKALTDQLSLAGSAYQLLYNRIAEYEFGKVDLGISYTTLYDAWALRSAYSLERNIFGGRNFQNISTVNFNIGKNPFYDSLLGFDFKYAKIQQYDPRYSFLAGNLWQLQARAGLRDHGQSLQITAGLEDSNSKDDHDVTGQLLTSYSPRRYQLGLGGTALWFHGATVNFDLQFQLSEYKDKNTERSITIKRNDERLVMQMELAYPLSHQVWLSARYRHLKNDSNIATYTYTSNNSSLGLLWRY